MILPSNQIPHIWDLQLLIHVFCLRYLKPLFAGDAEKDLALGSKMLYLSKQVKKYATHTN